MGCLYLEIEGQSWLVDNVDRGLMKVDQLDRLTKINKIIFDDFFVPAATV